MKTEIVDIDLIESNKILDFLDNMQVFYLVLCNNKKYIIVYLQKKNND